MIAIPAMSSEAWLRVKDVLAAVLEEPAGNRAARLDELCGSDAALRHEVESLLEADAGAATFFDAPLVSAAADPPDPNIGRILGPYLVEGCIGRGGMGSVYLARRADEVFERRVAIKTIRRGMDSELVVRRFRHERQILASLEHPNIALLFDGGTTPDGLPYFVMEYVAGTPIDRYANEHGLSTIERLHLCLPVFDAVQHAHDRQVVHRDIKPTNVMVSADGHPKLLDFGIATILNPAADGPSTVTSLGRPMTPDYASPEQIRGEPVSPSTDVYALGVLVYELLTGRRPYHFATHTPEEIARVVCEQDPERPSSITRELRQSVGRPLDDILLKALRKEPHERYPSAAAFADDLRRYLGDQPVAASWDGRSYRARRLFRRYRNGLAVAALLVAAVASTVMLTSRTGDIAADAPPASTAAATPQNAPRPSVAVLAFRNLSARETDEWLSTAIAEMLTTELAGDGQLRVLPAERIARARADLVHATGDGAAQDEIERLRRALASDMVVTGTFAVNGARPATVRIDVRALRPRLDPISVASDGDPGELFSLVADIGRDLRAHLGLHDAPDSAVRTARAAFPETPEGTRLYAEGAARLRVLDAVSAKDLLERAAAREPANPLIQTSLAAAWAALGYDARAASAAQKAFDASAALGREQRLIVEGRLYAARRQWAKAADVYRTLWGFFSDNVEYGLQLAAAQTAAGRAGDALETVEAMRRLPAPQTDDPRIDLEQAQAASARGDFPRELAAAQQAVRRAEQSGSRHLVARAHLVEGRSFFNQGELARAEASLEVARQAFIDVGDRAGAATALNSLASVMSDRHELPRAEQMYREALAVSEQIGDRRGMSAGLNNLGIVLKDERRYDEARAAHERALVLRREIADINWMAVSLSNIGVVLFEQDRLREAAAYYRQSLALARQLGDRRNEVRALHNMAIVDRELGNLAAARSGYEASLATRAEIGDRAGGVAARVELGIVLLAQGDFDRATKTEEEALAISRDIDLKPGEGQALFQLGEIARASGDLALARRRHEEALAIRQALKETRTIQESRLAMAQLSLQEGKPAEAERQARELLRELGSQPQGPLQAETQLVVSRARLAAGDTAGAEVALQAARQRAGATERVVLRRSLDEAEAALAAARARGSEARAGKRPARAGAP